MAQKDLCNVWQADFEAVLDGGDINQYIDRVADIRMYQDAASVLGGKKGVENVLQLALWVASFILVTITIIIHSRSALAITLKHVLLKMLLKGLGK